MQKFGEKFCRDNPDTFGNADCVYLLSYATMMLQTSLHNPNAIKCRMTIDAYVNMCKGINNGSNLEYDFLKSIYE
jgi:Sec7-like guanine-nucleotide exchange factor